MDTKGTVSVIVPVYNVENYLRQCIDSVTSQTYGDWELFLVDDGSEDMSGTICDEYAEKDGRIQVIHKENGGASTARNRGLDAATGEFVYFLDGDDWMENDTFEILTSHMDATGSEIAVIDGVCLYEDGDAERRGQPYIHKREYPMSDGPTVFSQMIQNRDVHVQPSLFMYRRSLLDRYALRFEEGIIFEDSLFFFESFCLAERVSFVRRALFHRRYRAGSLMTAPKYKRNFLSAVRVLERAKAFSRDNGIYASAAVGRYLSDRAMNAMGYYRRLSRPERKECGDMYAALLDDIRREKGYGSRATLLRSFGVVPWAAYKGLEKLGVTGGWADI